MIPYARQWISAADIDAVVEVLKSDWLTQGPAVQAFEKALCNQSGTAHCVAMNNATAALHIACLALGVGPGDWVLTVPNTFVASANAALYCGANVDFVDIDPQTLCMDAEALAEKLAQLTASGQSVKAIIPVHFAGLSCDMAAIAAAAKPHGCAIIEDASHAIGGLYKNRPIGNCVYSDITVFSFHPVKIITTGEGGALLTNDPVLYERARRLANHGLVRNADDFVVRDQPEWFGEWAYQQVDLGFNYRITDFQCALGLSQLNALGDWIERRNQLALNYQRAFMDLDIEWQVIPDDCLSAYHLFVVQLPNGSNRRQVFNLLRQSGIGVNVHYIPVHTQPFYQARGFYLGQFPVAEAYYQRTLSLPLYPKLLEEEQQQVIEQFTAVLRSCSA
jgi:UDP-4-amino-4,6-dideoxy-N-acetyl-beta-L-altrosamine transaminase